MVLVNAKYVGTRGRRIDLSFVDVIDFLQTLGVRNLTWSGNEASFSCPGDFHRNGDNRPSARMNLDSTLWVCHSCLNKGNAITFLADFENIPRKEAKKKLEDKYKNEQNWNLELEIKKIMNYFKRDVSIDDFKTPNLSWLDAFKLDWHTIDKPYKKYMVEKRGFHPLVMFEFFIGYDYFTDRITIPILDDEGSLVGFKGRDWQNKKDNPKYMILGDRSPYKHFSFDPYPKSRFVFNLYNAKRYNSVFICEGELNAIWMHQLGYKNTVAISGMFLSQHQRELIKENFDEVIIFLDPGNAGDIGTQRIVDSLKQYIDIKVIRPKNGDPQELTKSEIDILVKDAKPKFLLEVEKILDKGNKDAISGSI